MLALSRAVLELARRLLPPRVKRSLKRVWDPNQNMTLRELRVLSRSHHRRHFWPFSIAARFRADAGTSPTRYDILCFGIFEWEFRFQRPQQILSELAKRGHRVFYIVNAHLHHGPEPFTIRSVARNVWQVRMQPAFDLYHG